MLAIIFMTDALPEKPRTPTLSITATRQNFGSFPPCPHHCNSSAFGRHSESLFGGDRMFSPLDCPLASAACLLFCQCGLDTKKPRMPGHPGLSKRYGCRRGQVSKRPEAWASMV